MPNSGIIQNYSGTIIIVRFKLLLYLVVISVDNHLSITVTVILKEHTGSWNT